MAFEGPPCGEPDQPHQRREARAIDSERRDATAGDKRKVGAIDYESMQGEQDGGMEQVDRLAVAAEGAERAAA